MIPEHEWLDQAKRLSIGMKLRVRHQHERRPNMIIGNSPDRWWCYCQACKEGAVVQKEHVILGVHEVAPPADLTFPPDLRLIHGTDAELPVLRFLARKCMDSTYLPPLWYSASRKRMLLDTGHGWMGRDITEKSPQKWITYNRQKLLGRAKQGAAAIVVEDTFSWYKVQWALRNRPVPVLCALGTGIHDALVLELAQCNKVVWFFDGDEAGYKGADEGVRRMRAFGLPSTKVFPSAGKDPKDMQIHEILTALGGAL